MREIWDGDLGRQVMGSRWRDTEAACGVCDSEGRGVYSWKRRSLGLDIVAIKRPTHA